ncbi:hypothetical protein Cgig2_030816 [Carnegiea gigantea]|uniref:Uncharacterized protein n=1 Tax=Carnegiea gigantea TaxID=171969 RepID=A0A9Q1KTT6_9CARY|nr:hypothetical protein Cgig2_030816 [Carnegiea gigantea]
MITIPTSSPSQDVVEVSLISLLAEGFLEFMVLRGSCNRLGGSDIDVDFSKSLLGFNDSSNISGLQSARIPLSVSNRLEESDRSNFLRSSGPERCRASWGVLDDSEEFGVRSSSDQVQENLATNRSHHPSLPQLSSDKAQKDSKSAGGEKKRQKSKRTRHLGIRFVARWFAFEGGKQVSDAWRWTNGHGRSRGREQQRMGEEWMKMRRRSAVNSWEAKEKPRRQAKQKQRNVGDEGEGQGLKAEE